MRRVHDHGDDIRCSNAHCGKWVELYQEKTCPKCGRRSVERAGKTYCDQCSVSLLDGDLVCPLCGSKQRSIAELRRVNPEKLTAYAHLLHEAQPSLSLAACKERCRGITRENPYRVSFDKKTGMLRSFIRHWNEMGGIAAACLPRETSRRPVVLLRSFNRAHEAEHARLLYEAIRKSELAPLKYGETVALMHEINRSETPIRLKFEKDFDHIEAWVAAWRKLGGTASRAYEFL